MSNNLGISIVKIAIYSHFSSLKVEDLGQNPGGFRVLKNCELQNRELQNPELQGFSVMTKTPWDNNKSRSKSGALRWSSLKKFEKKQVLSLEKEPKQFLHF